MRLGAEGAVNHITLTFRPTGPSRYLMTQGESFRQNVPQSHNSVG